MVDQVLLVPSSSQLIYNSALIQQGMSDDLKYPNPKVLQLVVVWLQPPRPSKSFLSNLTMNLF